MLHIKKSQKGVSLYLTIVILSVLTGAILAMIGISVSQIKVMSTLGDSVIAFYAADTGIENSLYNIRKEGGSGEVSGTLNQASYNVLVSINETTFIESRGSYKKTKRAIEINY